MVDGWEVMDDGLPTYLLYASAYALPVGDYDGVITVNDELLAQRPSSWLVRPLPEIRLPRTSNQNQSTDRRAPNGASAASSKSREWLLVSSQSALRSPALAGFSKYPDESLPVLINQAQSAPASVRTMT
jgi:hypothetical protein